MKSVHACFSNCIYIYNIHGIRSVYIISQTFLSTYAIRFSIIFCYLIVHYITVLLYCGISFFVILCCVMFMTLHCFLSQCAVLYYVVLFDVVPLYIILSSVISSHIFSYYMMLYYVILHYLLLSYAVVN